MLKIYVKKASLVVYYILPLIFGSHCYDSFVWHWFFFLLSVVWLVAYEFHNSRSSLGWIFLSIQLLWGVALFIFIVSCGGSAQLIALVFNTANKSDWGHFYLRCHLLENSNGFIFCRNYYRSNVTCWGKYF